MYWPVIKAILFSDYAKKAGKGFGMVGLVTVASVAILHTIEEKDKAAHAKIDLVESRTMKRMDRQDVMADERYSVTRQNLLDIKHQLNSISIDIKQADRRSGAMNLSSQGGGKTKDEESFN